MSQESALRVLVIVPNQSPLWHQACSSPENLISPAMQVLEQNGLFNRTRDTQPDTLLLAVQKWAVRLLFVFDISNKDYNAELGHLLEQNNLRVAVVHFSSRQIAHEPRQAERERIKGDIANLHDANGYGAVPPFIEDHTMGVPVYLNPRSLTQG
ncbi:hypothetical protein BJX70DRAFT_380907 [Aspergillus crustosus]